MAQNITLLGASYSAVPAVVLPKTGGGTARFDDASITTATASDVASGKIFLANDGTITTGTSSGGGGASSWTKVCEKSYQISTTSTSTTTQETWATGHSEIWQSDKWIYVEVKDTAGKRPGYFYATAQFFLPTAPFEGSTSTSASAVARTNLCYTSNSKFTQYNSASTTGYGVYVDTMYSDGRLRVRKRYNSNYSLTIDSTYKVEVYLLDPAGGVPIFT